MNNLTDSISPPSPTGPVPPAATVGKWPAVVLSPFFVLLLLPLLLYVLSLPVLPLMEPDETRYALIPQYMNLAGDYVTPHLKGVVYLEKPPLVYWTTAVFFRLFGENAFAARLAAGLSAWGCLLLVYGMGRYFHDRKTGLYGAAVLSVSLLPFALGRINILDMPLTFFVCLAIWCGFRFFHAPDGPGRNRWRLGFYGACALAFLTKGVIGALFPPAILLLYLLWMRRGWAIFRLFSPGGLVLFAFPVGAWLFLVQLSNPEFLWFFFIHEHWLRYTTQIHERVEPFWYYLPVAFFGFTPWWAFLAPAATSPRRVKKSSGKREEAGAGEAAVKRGYGGVAGAAGDMEEAASPGSAGDAGRAGVADAPGDHGCPGDAGSTSGADAAGDSFPPPALRRPAGAPPLFSREEIRLSAVWSGFIILFFSLSSSKLASYIAPAMLPPAALLGHLFRVCEERSGSRREEQKTSGFDCLGSGALPPSRRGGTTAGEDGGPAWPLLPPLLQALALAGVTAVPLFVEEYRRLGPPGGCLLWLFLPVLFAAALAILPEILRRRAKPGWFAAIYILFALYLATLLMPLAHYLTPGKSALDVARAIQAHVPTAAVVYQYRMTMYGIDFYTGRQTPIVEDPGELGFGAEQLPPGERARRFPTDSEFVRAVNARRSGAGGAAATAGEASTPAVTSSEVKAPPEVAATKGTARGDAHDTSPPANRGATVVADAAGAGEASFAVTEGLGNVAAIRRSFPAARIVWDNGKFYLLSLPHN
ncbi:MAG: glycosyltransferase family 39 protein [Pseudomonadota bacterium]|nr:glycosyltransferase family 39 protein [Pseudomonadota bacterium]